MVPPKFRAWVNLPISCILVAVVKFSEFKLDQNIILSLQKMGFTSPTEIQEKTLVSILEGRDVMGLAETGSGKTAACAIPICQLVNTESNVLQALILVPTRELALQYATEVQKIGEVKGVKALAILGGEDASLQQAKLRQGVHVAVATPGRLIDFIYSKSIALDQVETVVLDEADEMLSMGFIDDLNFILDCLIQNHQTLLFSATMPDKIKKLISDRLQNPVEVVLQKKEKSPTQISQNFVFCHFKDRDGKLAEWIKKENPTQAIIFCHSRVQVESVCRHLKSFFSVKSDYLHAGMNQDIRNIVTQKFRSGKIKYLVATDVASRGLDFSQVSHVFIYQLGEDPHLYVHRVGRTGRYGKKGVAITFVTKRELRYLDRLSQFLKRDPKWLEKPPTFSGSRSSRQVKKK